MSGALILVAALAGGALAQPPIPHDPPLRWWKGNLHTHTLWSDGNDFPEMVAEWYRDHDYHFLALSDHNTLSQGTRWMPVEEVDRRSRGDAMAAYLERWGDTWVQTRDNPDTGAPEVRLKPLTEYRALVEERDRFIMIQGEEITDSFDRKPVHLNASNLAERIEPRHGDSVRETIRNNVRALIDQAEQTGRVAMIHLNHPNFGYAVTAEDIADVVEERFFEVFNGHSGVHNLGNDDRPGTEEIWDIANTIRIASLDAPPLDALAVDDSHSYHGHSPVSVPGRGWIMVRARHLTPESIIHAIERGDFYASTGVTLQSIDFDDDSRRIDIRIAAEPGVSYVTRFIGTRRGVPLDSAPRTDADGNQIDTTRRYSPRIGETLAEVEGPNPTYQLAGDELYVRAVVTSDATPDRPTRENEAEKAWTQPVGWR